MSYDPQNPESFGQPSPPPQKSGGNTVLWIVLGILGVLCLLCCGGGVGLYFFVSSRVEQLANSISHDPAVVREVTAKICDIDIPPGLEPQTSMDMEIMGFNAKMANYSDGGVNAIQITQTVAPDLDQQDDFEQGFQEEGGIPAEESLFHNAEFGEELGDFVGVFS